jgi:CRISPR-associated protein Cas2
MVVMTLELVPPRLRGGLTRWLTEIGPGVYVGRVNALVRDLLWDAVIEEAAETGRAVQVYRTNTEQGFEIRMHGDSKRSIVEIDGLQLVANQHAAWRDWIEEQDEDN